MSQRIILVTGSTPPESCGVGDYTFSLASALEKAGGNVQLFCHRKWNVSGTLEAVRRSSSYRDALIHMQYPTLGYGHSLGPQLLAFHQHSLVTIHEFSLAHTLRKLSLFPFTLNCPRLISTSEFEGRLLGRWMPWVRDRMRVIPIGSNIPVGGSLSGERKESIAYFGLIAPRKGLEDFVEFSRMVRANDPHWDLLVIGKIVPGQEAYFRALKEISQTSRISWILDRSPKEVADVLSSVALGYLPFPDGASERRGSLKAVCGAGLPCITTRGEQTPPNLEAAVAFSNSPQSAVHLARRLMADRTERARLSRCALEYARQFTWEKIAEMHLALYAEIQSKHPLLSV